MNEPLDVERSASATGRWCSDAAGSSSKDEDEAMDACQDVFVRLIERRDRLDASHPSSLLYIIATNICLNRIRDRGRHAVPTEDERA